MDEARRAHHRRRLEEELAALDAADRGTEADRAPVELDQQSVGRLSRMDAMQVQAMAAASENRRRMRRARIESALRRMESGEYGYCLRCDEPIGLGRLRVDATTTVCIACASGKS